MEKFYIVTNEDFLKEIQDFNAHAEERRLLINEFFEKYGIVGNAYHISGDGFVNKPFEESQKGCIRLYIEDREENVRNFGKELLEPKKLFFDSDVMMRSFRKNSKTLKDFQNLCIERNIVINLHRVREGDYFKELCYGGYSVSRFVHDDKLYLKINSTKHNTITPAYDGFTEIKGSEYFKAYEAFEEKQNG